MHWKGLWALFRYHGNVIDAFILKKRSKNGNRFGFVRFSKILDAQRAISRINGFVIMGSMIWVKMARFRGKRKIWKNVQAQTSSNQKERDTPEREGERGRYADDEQLWKLQHCLVGELAFFCDTKSLTERIARIDLVEISIRRIRGIFFLTEVPGEEPMEILKHNDLAYLKEFFINIEPWLEKNMVSERVAQIDILGVPLHCWNYVKFKRMAGLWGELVSMGENLTKVNNFETMELLISIKHPYQLEEIIMLEVGDGIFPIRIKERGLTKVIDDKTRKEWVQ
ncbi:hypothetical protein Goari_020466 [Gossypium aridum]|uniref:RRM domain-containing protein n=1 Tax=Gossypium aridum TaxID=34290 RepID=A0A7J8YNW5_GOSAI|nr:hypothetical protein [Gossypium aridum]